MTTEKEYQIANIIFLAYRNLLDLLEMEERCGELKEKSKEARKNLLKMLSYVLTIALEE
ncbi:MAG: hypothetical protein QXT14_08845 [Candidatus Bathyarchaeia archaeon]